MIRNAGNIVPPPTAGASGEAASIEFAVTELKVKHIIVCGHSHCGAMTSLLNRGESRTAAGRRRLSPVRRAGPTYRQDAVSPP